MFGASWRMRAATLLNTITMQKVAWAVTSVARERSTPRRAKPGVQRDAGDDARQRERQHDDEAEGWRPKNW